jgi:hypothetical protein
MDYKPHTEMDSTTLKEGEYAVVFRNDGTLDYYRNDKENSQEDIVDENHPIVQTIRVTILLTDRRGEEALEMIDGIIQKDIPPMLEN